MITPALIQSIREIYRLDWHGIHGANHWARVRNNGLRLAATTGANTKVIEAFSFLHDSCRLNDGHDPDHGPRAAEFAKSINGTLICLKDNELTDLVDACTKHTLGMVTGFNDTVSTCWDADRLDLGRVGKKPDPKYLCTDAAKQDDIISWAYLNSVENHRCEG
jgi:uncharacterized protein